MTNLEQIFRSYSGPSLEYIMGIVPDLKRMRKVCIEKGNLTQGIDNSLDRILKHLIRNNVPSNVAQKFIYGND